MAFVASEITSNGLNRAWSIGPIKIEIQSFSALSTDTAGTVNALHLSRIDQVLLMGEGTLCQTAAPSVSGTAVTLAMGDPASACTGYVAKNVNGIVVLIGR